MTEQGTDIQLNYKTRMVIELVDLTGKIALLNSSLNSGCFKENKEKLELMYKQLDFMQGYSSILMDRIFIELK